MFRFTIKGASSHLSAHNHRRKQVRNALSSIADKITADIPFKLAFFVTRLHTTLRPDQRSVLSANDPWKSASANASND